LDRRVIQPGKHSGCAWGRPLGAIATLDHQPPAGSGLPAKLTAKGSPNAPLQRSGEGEVGCGELARSKTWPGASFTLHQHSSQGLTPERGFGNSGTGPPPRQPTLSSRSGRHDAPPPAAALRHPPGRAPSRLARDQFIRRGRGPSGLGADCHQSRWCQRTSIRRQPLPRGSG